MTGADPDNDVEPDHRFTLANERTFLAWIRTALGLLAGGVAVRQLAEPSDPRWLRNALAVSAIAASVVLTVGGYVRWRQVQRAMRRGEPLPAAPFIPLVAAGVAAIGVITLAAVAWG